MEQLFWQNNRNRNCGVRKVWSPPEREGWFRPCFRKDSTAKLSLCCYGYKIGFEREDKNKVIYLGGNRK